MHTMEKSEQKAGLIHPIHSSPGGTNPWLLLRGCRLLCTIERRPVQNTALQFMRASSMRTTQTTTIQRQRQRKPHSHNNNSNHNNSKKKNKVENLTWCDDVNAWMARRLWSLILLILRCLLLLQLLILFLVHDGHSVDARKQQSRLRGKVSELLCACARPCLFGTFAIVLSVVGLQTNEQPQWPSTRRTRSMSCCPRKTARRRKLVAWCFRRKSQREKALRPLALYLDSMFWPRKSGKRKCNSSSANVPSSAGLMPITAMHSSSTLTMPKMTPSLLASRASSSSSRSSLLLQCRLLSLLQARQPHLHHHHHRHRPPAKHGPTAPQLQ